jgi:hypothetical protein
LENAKAELAKRERELKEKSAVVDKDYKALREWQDVLRGLSTVSEDDKSTFLRVAGQALNAGREAREADENRDESAIGNSDSNPTQK